MIKIVAVIISFLMPFYLIALIYEVLRTKEYAKLRIVAIVGCLALTALAYLYLEPKQRLIIMGNVVVLGLTLMIVFFFC